MLFSVASTKLGGAGSRQETETGFRFQNRKRKLVSVSKIGNENMETGFRRKHGNQIPFPKYETETGFRFQDLKRKHGNT